jgi:extradiol dioxygenase family protein
LDEPYIRFKGKKEEQETFFIKDPHGNILELKTLQNS